MACRYSDGTEINIGDTVEYKTLDIESYSRGYGASFENITSKVVGFKVVFANGAMERLENIIRKISSGPVAAAPARAAGEGSARKSRKTRKQRRNH